MAVQRMDNVSIGVKDLAAAVAFFVELGLEVEGESTVEGPWVDQTVGMTGVRSAIVMMRTPDGHGKIELTTFITPPARSTERIEPNSLGMVRIMFAVDDLRDTVARLTALGGEVVGEIAQFEDFYLLCYFRGPEGILLGLAEQIG